MSSMAHPPTELEEALRHEAALRRLAAALCGSAAAADDAVQHTMVQVATGRRPRGSPLLGFLHTTLRNHASNLRRLAARRLRRERAAAVGGAAPAADELVAREQLRRRVADAVLALAEPYRTTVWLRWFEDLDADAVARRMAVPLATVRTRRQRAHAQLRQRLDRDFGDRQWMLLAAPIAAAAPGTGLAMIAGGSMMAKTTLCAVLGVALVVGVLALRPWREPDAA